VAISTNPAPLDGTGVLENADIAAQLPEFRVEDVDEFLVGDVQRNIAHIELPV
jgi:hypothetical protein